MKTNFSIEDDEKSQPLETNDLIDSKESIKFAKKKGKKQNEDRRISGKLTVLQKFCFGVGGLPYEMTSNCLGLFMPVFLLEMANLKPMDIFVISLIGKMWDAFTDPMIGFIVFYSKKNCKYGKLKPWVILFAPFAVLSYILFWYVPDIKEEYKLYWYLFFYCSFQMFLSCLRVPYTSLTMYLTHNQKERDSATGYRMGSEVVGVLLAATIQGVIIEIYSDKFPCDKNPIKIIANDTILNTNMSNTNIPSLITDKKAEGYLISAVIMSVIYLVCCFTTFIGTDEVDDIIIDKNNHFIRSVGAVFKSRSYITLLFSLLFNSVAVKLLQTNFALYCKYSIQARHQYHLLIIVLLISIILSMPIWQYMIKKFGKKCTYCIGLITFIPNLIPLMFITDQIWLMFIITVSCGFSMSSYFLLPWSMLPDVIDDFMIKTGERKESIFYSFYVFFTKFASGTSVSFSFLLLKYSDYYQCQNGCCNDQPDTVKLSLRLLLVPIPIAMVLISLLCLYLHPINDKKRIENKEILEDMRSKSRDELINPKA